MALQCSLPSPGSPPAFLMARLLFQALKKKKKKCIGKKCNLLLPLSLLIYTWIQTLGDLLSGVWNICNYVCNCFYYWNTHGFTSCTWYVASAQLWFMLHLSTALYWQDTYCDVKTFVDAAWNKTTKNSNAGKTEAPKGLCNKCAMLHIQASWAGTFFFTTRSCWPYVESSALPGVSKL